MSTVLYFLLKCSHNHECRRASGASKAQSEEQSVIANQEKESEKAIQNTEAIEKELKKLLKEEKSESGGPGDRVVYVAQ